MASIVAAPAASDLPLAGLPPAATNSSPCSTPRRGVFGGNTSTGCIHGGALAAPSPDSTVKGLIAAMDMLQQQQEHAEALRLAAEQAALAAQAEQAGLKGQLHKALRRAAQLDDQEQAVQAELDARLLEQAQHAEQLRLAARRLSWLRAETSSASDSSAGGAGAHQAQQHELAQKQALAVELQRRLRGMGVEEATLVQLCADTEAHSSAAAGPPQHQQQAGVAEDVELDGNAVAPGQQRAAWLAGGGGGLLATFLRRGSTVTGKD